MTVKELEEIMLDDEHDRWALFTNSQDITDVMLGWKLTDQVELVDVGCLFVKWDDSGLDLESVFYSESNIPYHHKQVYQLK